MVVLEKHRIPGFGPRLEEVIGAERRFGVQGGGAVGAVFEEVIGPIFSGHAMAFQQESYFVCVSAFPFALLILRRLAGRCFVVMADAWPEEVPLEGS